MSKLNWLEKVKADAERITLRRIREMKEEQAYKSGQDVAVTEEVSESIEEEAKPVKARKDK